MRKRILSVFMALALTLTLLPTSAMASGLDDSLNQDGVVGGEGNTGLVTVGEKIAIEDPQTSVAITDTFANRPFRVPSAQAGTETASWIGRIPSNTAAKAMYDWLVEATKTNGILTKSVETDALKQTFNAGTKDEFSFYGVKLAEVTSQTEADAYVNAVQSGVDAFDRDHPEVFWLMDLDHSTDGKTPDGLWTTWVGSESQYTIYVGFTNLLYGKYNNNWDQIATDIQTRDAQITAITKDLNGKSQFEQVKALDKWLTEHNAYFNDEKDLNTAPDTSRKCLGALIGQYGADGPVCEGYARAFKVLCDRLGIPCVLVDGPANGGNHMWNYVQMTGADNTSAWYAVDVTWDDPVSGKQIPDTKALSGREHQDYLLVGSGTGESGKTFGDTHTAQNSPSEHATPEFLSNAPSLSTTAYTEPGAPTSLTVSVDASNSSVQTDTESGVKFVLVPHATAVGAAETVEITLTATPTGGSLANPTYEWSASGAPMDGITITPVASDTSKAVLTIANTALKDVIAASGKYNGYTLTITATCSTTEGTTKLSVYREELKPTFIQLFDADNNEVKPDSGSQQTNIEIETGTTLTYTAKVFDQYGSEMQGQTVNWAVLNGEPGEVNNGPVTPTSTAKNDDVFTVTATAGSAKATLGFKVVTPKIALTEGMLTFDPATPDYTYDGKTHVPTIKVNDGEKDLVAGDYNVTYAHSNGKNNDTTSAGRVTVTITAQESSNYKGTITKTYEIKKAQPTITVSQTAITDLYMEGTREVTVTTTKHDGATLDQNDLKYTSSAEGVATATGTNTSCTITAGTTAGNATITISYAGDDNHEPATATIAVTVTAKPAVATVNITGDTSGEAQVGTTLTAKVTDPKVAEENLTYQWYADNSPITGATEKTYMVKAGDVDKALTVKVSSSDTNYVTATSTNSVTAKAIPTTLTLTPGATSIEYGKTTTITPAIEPNTADATKVTYQCDPAGVVTTTGTTVTAQKVGTVTITATFSDKENGYADATATATLKVTPLTVTPTVEVTGSYTYDGTAKTPTPTVKVTVDSSEIMLTENTDYTLSYDNNINATTDGSLAKVIVTSVSTSNYKWATPVEATFAIAKGTVTNTTAESLLTSKIGAKTEITLSNYLPAKCGGTPTYALPADATYGGLTAAIQDAVLTLTSKTDNGSQAADTVAVTIDGMQNYESFTLTITVTYTPKDTVTITATVAESLTYNGKPQTVVSEIQPSELADVLTIRYESADGTTYPSNEVAPKNAGSYKVTISIPADNEAYAATPFVKTFAIDPLAITVTAKDTEVVQNGTPTLEYTVVPGLADGDTWTVQPSVSVVDPANLATAGTYANGITVTGGTVSSDNSNYTITYQPGKLTVTEPAPVGTVATPTATPNGGTFDESVEVTLGCATEGAKIYYVTDTTTDPATDGTEYTGAITLTETTTIKAIAKKDGMNNSAPLEVTFTKNTPVTPVDPPVDPQPPVQQVVNAPVISPNGGYVYGTQMVTITSATAGASIYYTLDGTMPSRMNGILYTGAFPVYGDVLVRAIAVADGMVDSAVMSATFMLYTYTPSTPDPEPEPDDPNYEPPVSSGGSSQPTTPSNPSTPSEPTTPVQPTQPTVPEVTTRPEATVTEDGTASAVVTPDEVSNLVDQAVTGGSDTVVIAPVIGGDVNKTEVTLPASAASDIANQTNADLKVETPVADVIIPNDSLAGLGSQGGEIVISAEKTGESVDVAITLDGERIANMPIKAAIPTPCGPGTVAKIVDENGNVLSTVRKSSASSDGQTMNVPLDGSAKVVFVEGGKNFADVPASNWASSAVAFASSHELMNGVSEESFSPSQSMTRAMLAVVLHNLEGNPSAAYAGGFQDVTGGTWYAEAVQWASEKTIITGVSEGVFDPNSPITREQLVLMLYRYVGQPNVSGNALGRFSDSASVSNWAAQAMNWAVSNGIVNGSDGALNPQGSATRAEVAQMLMNFVSGGIL